jgi:hypothetical protein
MAAGFVRIKTPLPHATIEDDGSTYSVAAALSTVKLGGVGPEKAVLRFRRVAPPKTGGAIPVTVTIDGRRIAKLSLGGEPKTPVADSKDLAGPAVEQPVEMIPGPHVIEVAVGAGKGRIAIAVRLASEPVPLAASAARESPEAASPPSKEKAGGAGSKLEEGEAPEKRPARLSEANEEPESEPVATAPIPNPTSPAAPPVPSQPTAPASPAAPPAITKMVKAEPEPTSKRVGISLRLGIVDHLQLGVVGPTLGVAADYAVLPVLLVRLSVDYLNVGEMYQAAIGGPGSGTGTFETRLWTASGLVNLVYEPIIRGTPIRPIVGGGLGVAVAGVSTGTTTQSGPTSTSAAFEFALLAGLDAPLGPGRVGAEARWLLTTAGSFGDVARSLDVGGFLVEASYRYAF